MNSKEFLKSKLFSLSAEYPATVIKYYFDAFDNDHFICFHPKKDLEAILENEARTIDREFIAKFPAESLSFIEIDDNLQFDELLYEYIPTPSLEVKTINIYHLPTSLQWHYSEKTKYTQPLFLVRKIAKEEILVEKGDDEFALAA